MRYLSEHIKIQHEKLLINRLKVQAKEYKVEGHFSVKSVFQLILIGSNNITNKKLFKSLKLDSIQNTRFSWLKLCYHIKVIDKTTEPKLY